MYQILIVEDDLDLARLVKMAEKIRQQVFQLKQTDANRRKFIAYIAHDLRTPLTGIKGYLDTLNMNMDANISTRQECVAVALKQSNQLERLINELFELARLDSGDVQINPENFVLSELVGDVIARLSLKAKSFGIKLTCHIPPSTPLVHADIGRIERVITNLVDNALKYTPSGGEVILQIEDDIANHRVYFKVKDTGPGILQKDIPYLFDPYYKTSNQTFHHEKSTGLGLAISQKIMQLHNSRIEVLSIASGSEFSFSLHYGY